MKHAFLILLTAGLAAGTAQVSAQTVLYTAESVSWADGAIDGQRQAFSATPVQTSAQSSLDGNTARGEASASPGRVGVSVRSTTDTGAASTVPRGYPTPSDPSYENRAGFDGLISLASPDTVSLNLDLHGAIAWNNAGSGSLFLSAYFYTTTYGFLGAGTYEVSLLNGDQSGLGYHYAPTLGASYRITGTGLFSAYSGGTWSDPASPREILTTAT